MVMKLYMLFRNLISVNNIIILLITIIFNTSYKELLLNLLDKFIDSEVLENYFIGSILISLIFSAIESADWLYTVFSKHKIYTKSSILDDIEFKQIIISKYDLATLLEMCEKRIRYFKEHPLEDNYVGGSRMQYFTELKRKLENQFNNVSDQREEVHNEEGDKP